MVLLLLLIFVVLGVPFTYSRCQEIIAAPRMQTTYIDELVPAF